MNKVITAITVQIRNHQRLNIDLDGEYAFGVSRIVGAWLKVGESLSDEMILDLKNRDSGEVLYQSALGFLGYRLRSEKELRLNLAKKGFDSEEVEKVISRLRDDGYLNDSQFTKSWLESRTHFHPRSRSLLKYELRGKGIAEDLIENALNESVDDSNLAMQAAAQYGRRLAGSDWLTFRKKLSGYLARRGFSYTTVLAVVKTAWDQESDQLGNT